MRHTTPLLVLAIVTASGCSDSSRSPTSPSSTPPSAVEAAADGSTLKVKSPAPVSPADGATLESEEVTLTATAATPTFPEADGSKLRHRFHLLTADGRSAGDAIVNGTSWKIPFALDYETTYRWRVRAEADGAASAWSATWSFRTPDDPGGLPRGPYPSSGPEVAGWVARHFPEYLAGGISLRQRLENMEFLRDRMIEAGRCGGLDLAWNLKRGVGPHSHDALAWRIGNRVEVVDIALAFDDPSQSLRLSWDITRGPAGYDPYRNRFRCRP